MFTEAIDELVASKDEDMLRIAMAMRVANVSGDEWKKLVDKLSPKHPATNRKKEKTRKQMTADEHRAVIARLRGI